MNQSKTKTPEVFAHFPPFENVVKREVVAQHKRDGEPSYVVGFLFHKGRVVLIKKTKPEWQKGLLNGVGGKIEKNETPLQAMRREWWEETGTWVWGWRQFCTLEFSSGVGVHFFVAYGQREIQTTTEEQVAWYKVDKLKKLKALPNLQWLVPMALDKDLDDESVVVIKDKE